jgi:hypothetical protein
MRDVMAAHGTQKATDKEQRGHAHRAPLIEA